MNRFALSLLLGTAALGSVTTTYAADLIIEEPMAEVGIVDVGGDWDGAYIGIFAGYGWGTATEDPTDVIFPVDGLDIDGWLLGVTLGANFTLTDGIVAGIVGDIAWSDIDGYDVVDDTTADLTWVGSLRGRLGFDGGAFLPYVTAGLAAAGATVDYAGDEDSNTHIGWTVGAGVEFAVSENVSIDLLYRYSDYGAQTYEVVPDADVSFTTHTVQVGLNWGF